jgi:hypothetical protein
MRGAGVRAGGEPDALAVGGRWRNICAVDGPRTRRAWPCAGVARDRPRPPPLSGVPLRQPRQRQLLPPLRCARREKGGYAQRVWVRGRTDTRPCAGVRVERCGYHVGATAGRCEPCTQAQGGTGERWHAPDRRGTSASMAHGGGWGEPRTAPSFAATTATLPTITTPRYGRYPAAGGTLCARVPTTPRMQGCMWRMHRQCLSMHTWAACSYVEMGRMCLCLHRQDVRRGRLMDGCALLFVFGHAGARAAAVPLRGRLRHPPPHLPRGLF